MMAAMFSIAFFGLMRVGEITKAKQGTHSILLSQVKSYKQYISITIANFKHNLNKQPVEIVLQPQQQIEICPVATLIKYLQIRGNQPGPLFCFPDNSPIPREFFTTKLKACLNFCGLDYSRYKTHSFCIGGASHFVALGYSDAKIRLLGRWKSDAFKKYIRCQKILNSTN
jgi:hypothetical protein